MGWALEHLTAATRERIARELFEVTSHDGDWLNGICPLHGDNNPSLGYNIADDGFNCFASCVDPGDLVDLWCLVHGYDRRSKDGFKAFKQTYADDIGVGQPKRKTPANLRPKEGARQAKEAKTIPESVYKAFAPVPPAMASELRFRRGWSQEAIDKLGIRQLSHYRKKADLYSVFPIPERDRVVIPIRDDAGTLWNLRTYYPFGVPPSAPENTAKIISWGKGHGHARLFPNPGMLRPDEPILLCEGEADCICAWSYGLNAITQTSKTTSSWPADHLQAVAGRKVIIAYDADQAGQNYAQKTAAILSKAGCEVRILEWPDFMGRQPDGEWPENGGEDLTDFFVKHHKEIHQLHALMENAPLFGSEIDKPSDNPPGKHLKFFRHSVNGRFGFGERLLADYLLEQTPMLYHDKSGQLYRWEGSYYVPWSEEQLKRAAIEALGDEAKASWVNASCSLAMSLVSMPPGRDINDRPEWLCLQNGMFNLDTLELVPHSPEYMSTIKLGVSWLSEHAPKPERWLSFLAETIKTQEVIDQLQEYMGYGLTRYTGFGKALLLYGPGADGKSRVVAVMRALAGPQNCSAVSMNGLDDQFQRAALFGKVLNMATEITTQAVQSDMFKAIVTGDPIQASFKHKDSFEFTPFCKLIYATNKMPRVFDNSDGFFRRIQPIVFKRQFLETDAATDPDLDKKLLAELDSIFAWAVHGWHRLKKNKRFTQSGETLDFMMRYRRYNNPVMGFVQDKCVIENTGKTYQITELYKAYQSYCREGNYKPVNRENFIEELQTAVRKLKEDAAIKISRPRQPDKTRPEVVEGVRLSPPEVNLDDSPI